MNVGREIVATDANPPRHTSRIVLRYGPVARVGTTAIRVRARRTRAGRDMGMTPALRAVRPPGRESDGRAHGLAARRPARPVE